LLVFSHPHGHGLIDGPLQRFNARECAIRQPNSVMAFELHEFAGIKVIIMATVSEKSKLGKELEKLTRRLAKSKQLLKTTEMKTEKLDATIQSVVEEREARRKARVKASKR